jgi:hypothetical protein
MAEKKRDILEFVEQSNFEQFTPTRWVHFLIMTICIQDPDSPFYLSVEIDRNFFIKYFCLYQLLFQTLLRFNN